MNGLDTSGTGAMPAFRFRDCALIPIASGRRASRLKELRDHLTPMVGLHHRAADRIDLV